MSLSEFLLSELAANIRFSSLPLSECPKNVTVTGVVERALSCVCSGLGEPNMEFVITGLVLVGPVTDNVNLSPP